MPQTAGNLIIDLLPRLKDAPKGISIYQAANSVQSIIYKKLLERESDLLASGQLDITIPAFDYKADLPSDFVSLAEKPRVYETADIQSNNSPYVAGSVTSYDSSLGILNILVNSLSDAVWTGTLQGWSVAVAQSGNPLKAIGYCNSAIERITGDITVQVDPGLSIVQGDYLYFVNGAYPVVNLTTDTIRSRRMEPVFLNEDNSHNDVVWWNWYGTYGQTWEPPCNRPYHYKILGNEFHVRPKPIADVNIKGRYFIRPATLSLPSDTLFCGDFFYEVYREGVAIIILKGLAIPDAAQEFMVLLKREVDTVVNARYVPLPKHRTTRRNFI